MPTGENSGENRGENTGSSGLVEVSPVPAGLTLHIDDALDYASVAAAEAAEPFFQAYSGDEPEFSSAYSRSGTYSLQIDYSRDYQNFLEIRMPGFAGTATGAKIVQMEWWEYRTTDYVWCAEKFNRYRGWLTGPGSNNSFDIAGGWESDGGFSQQGGQGAIKLFCNGQAASCGDPHWAVSSALFTPGAWNKFSIYIDVGDPGVANGALKFSINGTELVNMTTQVINAGTAWTLDNIWLGGWYTCSEGQPSTESEGSRYISDLKIWTDNA